MSWYSPSKFILVSAMSAFIMLPACRGNAPVDEMGPALPPGPAGASAPASSTASAAAGTPELASRPGAVICTMDGRPVTAQELERFREEQLEGRTHRGMERLEPQRVVESYRRYFAVKKLADAWKIRESGAFAEEMEYHRAALLAGPYRDHLMRTAAITPEDVSRTIPKDWVEMDFQVLGFATKEEAQKAYQAIRDDKGRIPDGDLPGEVKVAGKRRPQTGMLNKSTAYFDAFDVPALFALQVGEVSPPVMMDLGPVLAKVVARHDYTAQEQADLLARKRGEMERDYSFRKAGEIMADYPVKIDRPALEQAFQDFLLNTSNLSGKVVGMMGERPVSFRRFVRDGKPSIPFMVASIPRDRWTPALEQDIRDYAGGMALGFAAIKEGIGTDGLEAQMESYSRRAEYTVTLDRLWDQTTAAVGEEEIRSRYDKGGDVFVRPCTLFIQYYFSPVREEIEKLAERARTGGIPFPGLTKEQERASKTAVDGSVKTPPAMKERTVAKGASELQDIQDALFEMKKDEIRVVEGKMGVYLVRMADRKEKERISFSQVKDRIRNELEMYRRKSQIDAYLQKLTQDIVVEMVDPPPTPPGMPVPGFPDRG
jgi:hypothetical protein